MKSCTFFGHSDSSNEISQKLNQIITQLIEEHNVDTFYVGTHGNFDMLVTKKLKEIKSLYPHINFFIVCAYLSIKRKEYISYDNYLYPEGFEQFPPKFAITKRNNWMIDQSDYVITHVKNQLTNASKFKKRAERKGKHVINIE